MAEKINDHVLNGDTENDASWKDLPPAFLCHILTIIPHKRATVKAVCSTWKEAINSSLKEVKLPAADLPLLRQLPNIKHLTVQGPISSQQQQQQPQLTSTWPPSSAAASKGADCSSTSPASVINCWAAVEPRLLNRLHALQLAHCPLVVQQLAEGLWRPVPAAASSCSSSADHNHSEAGCSWSAPLPALTSLTTLSLTAAGDISLLLAALQQHCARSASGGLLGRGSIQDSGTALGQLKELRIVHCHLQSCSWGCCDGPGPLQLLHQLPALQLLQLSGCSWLQGVPRPVLECQGLTQLVLSNNGMLMQLPGDITRLTALQVLDLSGNAMLRSLGPSFSQLTSLTSLSLSGPSGLWADYSVAAATSCSSSSSRHQIGGASASVNPTASEAVGDGGGGAAASAQPPLWPVNLTAGCCSSSAAAARAALPQLLLPALPHQQQHQLLAELAGLQQLQRLVLSNNRQLMVLPGAVSTFTRLSHLDVRGCGLRWLGDDVLGARGLHELLLADNVLAELADDISRLQELKVLDVGGCGSLWRLPNSLLQLPKLEQLVVPSKALAQHVIEQLECRPDPVQVYMEPAEEEDDDWEQEAARADDTDETDDDQ